MEHLPPLISDLALILVTAGIVAIIFKRLKQPLVLGYIVAGFLVGPHMQWMPTVADSESISTWSNIGVIFLMFSLGLEFSFKKIIKMGTGPIIAAASVMVCMMGVGNYAGHLFGWGNMDCMFLGGMLAMSSTTIIYKALEDLGLRQQKFAGEVLSVLILEDILGIVLMVTLSALAVSRQVHGLEMAGSLLKLGFFLTLWFIVGIFAVPSFLRRTKKWMSGETLLIVSIGLCFLLVAFADSVGYSAAFGAFMMGSILAETIEAEMVEHVITPLKDMFGAIFFVSVGMMVDPDILIQYWQSIVAIIVAVMIGQALFGTMSFLLSGQPLKVALQCGFSLAQIGEFAFIIAALGDSLKVTSDFLYPVVVAVSIITTFFTPYMIKAAVPANNLIERILPDRFIRMKGRKDNTEKEIIYLSERTRSITLWKSLIISVGSGVVAYTILTMTVATISLSTLLPVARNVFGHWPGSIFCGIVTFVVASPFLRAIVMRKNHTLAAKVLRKRGIMHKWCVRILFFSRLILAIALIYNVILYLSPLYRWIHVIAAFLIVFIIVPSRRIKLISIRMERTFMQNLKVRERQSENYTPSYARKLQAHDLHAVQIQVPVNSRWGGKTLSQLDFSNADGIVIAAIQRGALRMNIPDAGTAIFPGDRLTVIGDDDGLHNFQHHLGEDMVEMKEDLEEIKLKRINILNFPQLVGKSLAESGIRQEHNCLVVGFEDEDGSLELPTAHRIIERKDTLWLVGRETEVKRFTEQAKATLS